MFRRCCWLLILLLGVGLVALTPSARTQDQLPPVPQGIEVQARGPVHEAFATLTGDPAPTKLVGKQPPPPIDEVPPDEKPAGDVIWISGYWGWDDDREDFLWVSGLWRTVPPGKQWVAGYWREDGTQWQYVPGFWSVAAKKEEQDVTYLPAPPELPKVADPGKPPTEDSFYVPGSWVWNGRAYGWRAGYWARVQPGYVWVPDHFRWSPSGYVWVGGYWDLAVSKRGLLYAPVVISPAVITVGFTYTPAYAVRDTIIVDSLFVRPTTCHYYFGDYYEVKYRGMGYQSCVVYSQSRYDSIIVYERYERRRDPTWVNVQVNLYNDRVAGRQPVPPRVINQTVINQTVIQQNVVQQNVVNNNVVNNNMMVAPTKAVVRNKNMKVEKIDSATRANAQAQAKTIQQVAYQRGANEKAMGAAPKDAPRTAPIPAPKAQPVARNMVVPKAPPMKPAPTVTAAPKTMPPTTSTATPKATPEATKQPPTAPKVNPSPTTPAPKTTPPTVPSPAPKTGVTTPPPAPKSPTVPPPAPKAPTPPSVMPPPSTGTGTQPKATPVRRPTPPKDKDKKKTG